MEEMHAVVWGQTLRAPGGETATKVWRPSGQPLPGPPSTSHSSPRSLHKAHAANGRLPGSFMPVCSCLWGECARARMHLSIHRAKACPSARPARPPRQLPSQTPAAPLQGHWPLSGASEVKWDNTLAEAALSSRAGEQARASGKTRKLVPELSLL